MRGVLFTNGSKYSGGSFNGHTRKRKSLLTAAFTKPRLGTLRSNDADGNENVKKNKRFNEQNDNFARASRFFVHFFPVFGRLRRENA